MGRWVKGCALGCGVILVLGVLLVVGAARWWGGTFGGPPPPAPQVGGSVALRPTFVLRSGGDYSAGTAVAVRLKPGGEPILLTALHLLGPAGGLERDLAPGEIDGMVREVRLSRIAGGQPVARARGSLIRSGGALRAEDPGVARDVAAFKLLPGSKVNALPLAERNPGFGEAVWLVGDVVTHEPQVQRLFPARVMVASPEGTAIRFQEEFPLQAFSGAPVINARREVVGLLIAGGGGGMGIINPAGTIRERLREAGIR